jgi:hypothetical protein
MHFLNQWVPFEWNICAQISFNVLKMDLMSSPLLSPPKFTSDFFLNLAAYDSTMGIVLVQEDDFLVEDVIYYLSHGLFDTKL